MRIALACPYGWDAPGGVQVHVRQLAAHLRERGHRTLVLAPARHPDQGPDVTVVGRSIPVPFNGSIAPVCPDPMSIARISRALDAFRPDVVHAHEPFSPSTSLFATLRSRVPVVATSHTYMERSWLFGAFSKVAAKAWERVALWLAVSEANAEFVRRHLASGASVRVVPNGADVELFRDAAPAELPAGRRVLFVSRLDPRKGFRVALRAFAELASRHRDLVLVVAGDGPDRAAVERLPREARARVVMLGNVPHAQLPPYHAASDLFVAPATGRESFGIILVEAMAAGLPVVATDIPGYREVVRADVDGLLVPPNDPGALAAAAERLLRDRELSERFAAAGPARAERFRWSVVAEEVEAAYRDALQQRNRPTRGC